MKPALVLLGLAVAALAAPSMDPVLQRSLQTVGKANIIISFRRARVAEVRERAVKQTYADRGARLTGLYTALKAHADETQSNVLAILNKAKSFKDITVRQLWITNQVIVRDADSEVVQSLLSAPEVAEIRQEREFPIEEPVEKIVHPEGYTPKAGEQWGIAAIKAPTVWSSGNNGQGTVVSNIDTGVRGTHVALRDNLRATYNWFDPYEGTTTPNDGNGHGTHTMGTIAGTQNGVGVAPGAQWISCKGCFTSSCTEAALLECGQWIACPTLPNGQSPNCAQAPDVSSNSWTGGQGNPWYDDIMQTWAAGDIATIFAQGNSGPYCGSAESPGDSNLAIGVGSTTSSNALSGFSSVGPTYFGDRIKPDVAAPGSDVFSSYYTSDTAYATLSGTSMAAPHVSGLVALLRAESPNISVSQIKSALQAGGQAISSSGRNCGGINENERPNHHAGHGRISAPESIAAARRIMAQGISGSSQFF